MKTEFITSVADTRQLFAETLPEIAFAGRSNVGKSSLINCIIDRKNLVKTGNTPGKTRLLNFFNIDDKMIFTDLPGYGYAQVSKKEKSGWGTLIENYFNKRRSLIMCVLLVDIRRSFEEEEIDLLRLLKAYNITPCVVLTKVDKLSKNQLMNARFRHANELNAINAKQLIDDSDVSSRKVDAKELILFSTITGEGKAEVRERIATAAGLNDFTWK